jgi:Negative regulator of sigma F
MGSVLAAAAFFLRIGFRPDIAQALETVRFLFKFVVTLSLAATATGFLVRLARPGVPGPASLVLLPGSSRAVSRRRSMRRIAPTTAHSSWPPGIRSRSGSSFWRAMLPAHAA